MISTVWAVARCVGYHFSMLDLLWSVPDNIQLMSGADAINVCPSLTSQCFEQVDRLFFMLPSVRAVVEAVVQALFHQTPRILMFNVIIPQKKDSNSPKIYLISLKKACRRACLAEMRSSGLYMSSFCSRSCPSGLRWGISFVMPVPSYTHTHTHIQTSVCVQHAPRLLQSMQGALVY